VPVGLYTRKGANGRRMYFRDGKLISEKSYKTSKARKKPRSTKKGQVRRTARRAYKNNNPKRSNKYMKAVPHPSITGMASGLAIAAYLNGGVERSKSGKITKEGVLKDITDGELGIAFNTLAGNAIDMIGTNAGRKTLVTAGLVAAAGAFARRQFPQLKLGGSRLYFRL